MVLAACVGVGLGLDVDVGFVVGVTGVEVVVGVVVVAVGFVLGLILGVGVDDCVQATRNGITDNSSTKNTKIPIAIILCFTVGTSPLLSVNIFYNISYNTAIEYLKSEQIAKDYVHYI